MATVRIATMAPGEEKVADVAQCTIFHKRSVRSGLFADISTVALVGEG
jgi:hypothetical protein